VSSSDEESEVNALSNATIGEFLMTERKLKKDEQAIESEAVSDSVSVKSNRTSPSDESIIYEEVRL
jgi:hypothetical protein